MIEEVCSNFNSISLDYLLKIGFLTRGGFWEWFLRENMGNPYAPVAFGLELLRHVLVFFHVLSPGTCSKTSGSGGVRFKSCAQISCLCSLRLRKTG